MLNYLPIFLRKLFLRMVRPRILPSTTGHLFEMLSRKTGNTLNGILDLLNRAVGQNHAKVMNVHTGFITDDGNHAHMHASNHTAALPLSTGGINQGDRVHANVSELRAFDINPTGGFNVRRLVQFFVVGSLKILIPMNRPADGQKIIRHATERFQAQSQPLANESAAAEPQEPLPAGIKILALRPGVASARDDGDW